MSATRHYAGVLVTADPGRFDEAVASLAALDAVTLHQRDPGNGRCVVVLETDDRAGQERLFRRIQGLGAVRSADLVYHLIDDGAAARLVLEDP
ncbi:MAG: NapD protein [Acidobacteria bacterium]|jgi:nitrate reductase NapAB chaperone NapD|nr:NapD protein [Acidobacteriota bacterium]